MLDFLRLRLISFASMLMLVCCSSSCPRQTSPCFQTSFFSSLASHFIWLREKKKVISFYTFFYIMFLLLFKKIWTVVAHFFGLLCLLVCFYALRYGPRPYALPIYLFFYIQFGLYVVRTVYVCMYIPLNLSFRLRLLSYIFFFYALFRRL